MARSTLFVLCVLFPLTWASIAFAQVAPAHLDILEASIQEVPPFDPNGVGLRTIAIDLTLAGTPTCTGASPFTVYGILIDIDLDPNTGLTDAAYDPLGVDARISAECDQATSQFISEIGPVVVGPTGPGGEATLTIMTIVADLPAVEFGWFAFALENADFTRLPAATDHEVWAIHERRIW